MTDQNPSPEANKKTQFWNRVQMLMVFAVFVAPVAGAFLYKPTSFNNFGDLYVPVRQVSNLDMLGKNGAVELDSFRRQWIFMVKVDGECLTACEDNILKMRQVRFMQNNDMTRIRTIVIHSSLSEAVATDLAAKYAPMEVYSIEKPQFDDWIKILKLDDAPIEAERDRIYVIDPAGNLMMSYPAAAEPKSIQKDIKRLLKTSQIG